MSIESFLGGESSEPMSEGAFEQFRQKMKAAQAQIQAIKKEEKRQKKTEDELLKILFQFVKTSSKKDLVILISRALEANIPASFILAIILLGNEDVQRMLKRVLIKKEEVKSNSRALIFFNENEKTFSLEVKLMLDVWMKEVLYQAEEYPQKVLKTCITEKDGLDTRVVNLASYVIEDYLWQKKIPQGHEKVMKSSEFILNGILEKVRENLENRELIN